MKYLICIYLLVVVIGPYVESKSFDFGNFFLGTGKKDLSSDSLLPRAASETNILESSSLDYSTEDTDTFNSSADDIFDYDYQNASADGLEVSSRKELEDIPATSNSKKASVEAEVQINETNSSEQPETTTMPSSPAATSEKSTELEEVPSTANASKELTTAVSGEQEEVVLGTTTETTAVLVPRNFFQKSIDWVEDAYTLSILIPITAGILFATTIILVIALCRCVRRCCRRRRFKRKPLPDSVKSLSASDRARLLGDTSDEEF